MCEKYDPQRVWHCNYDAPSENKQETGKYYFEFEENKLL